MLSCECSEWDGDGWYYYHPGEFTKLPNRFSRRKRCCSCNDFIEFGDLCIEFERSREPLTDIEENIYIDEVPLAPFWMCETCGEHWLNLTAAGYCLDITEDMVGAIRDYQEMTGFKKG